jgi:hypothetical protein
MNTNLFLDFDGSFVSLSCAPIREYLCSFVADILFLKVKAPYFSLSHSPDLPPLFRSSLISPMTIPRSIALSMSYKVRAATETAVKASISTPVCALVAAFAVMRAPSSSSVTRTSA